MVLPGPREATKGTLERFLAGVLQVVPLGVEALTRPVTTNAAEEQPVTSSPNRYTLEKGWDAGRAPLDNCDRLRKTNIVVMVPRGSRGYRTTDKVSTSVESELD
jgi:hypothetical protein